MKIFSQHPKKFWFEGWAQDFCNHVLPDASDTESIEYTLKNFALDCDFYQELNLLSLIHITAVLLQVRVSHVVR